MQATESYSIGDSELLSAGPTTIAFLCAKIFHLPIYYNFDNLSAVGWWAEVYWIWESFCLVDLQ